MTVAELIQRLSLMPPDSPVILATDAEGNALKRADGIETSYGYTTDNYLWETVHPDDMEEEEEEEEGSHLTQVVTIWPE
jgi:hypothetical protein